MLRLVSLLVAVALAALLTPPTPAVALDVCLKPVAVGGPVVRGWMPAMAAARDAWERKVARSHGPRYANWWYSGDRRIDCTWKGEGRNAVYRCLAVAMPCGKR